ncbi:ABC transporter permease [Mollicutes bacterium LVI A0078]|nr:ABC transporter permease [Mollicutes bacterium LVI A0075]WOO90114.1 ABC transporter permease [Mollicutes bacterium LVI A0078]
MKKSFELNKILVPIVSVLVAILIGSLILVLSGKSPVLLFQNIGKATVGDINGWLRISSMLVFTGLAIGFSYKGGLFNIGAEGQFIVASLATGVFAFYSPFPNAITPIIGLAVGFIAGALWAFIPGVLKAFYGISEVVITIMLNWIGMYAYDAIVTSSFHQVLNDQQTPILEPSKQLVINGWNYAFIISLLAIFAYWFILEKTTFGYELKAIGHSKEIADYTGISAKTRIIQTMMISGGFAGLAGATYALSYSYMSTILGGFANYGFDGIAVALLGALNSAGILFAALLMGALRNAEAAFGISRIPTEISDIIIALILLFSIIGPVIYKKMQKRGA